MSGDYYAAPKNPFAEVLKILIGKKPPRCTLGIYSSAELGDEVMGLQDWCSYNARPEWQTGIGIIEAADSMVKEAVANGNIPPGPIGGAS